MNYIPQCSWMEGMLDVWLSQLQRRQMYVDDQYEYLIKITTAPLLVHIPSPETRLYLVYRLKYGAG